MGSISDSDSNDEVEVESSYDLGKGVAIPRCELMMQGLSSNRNPNLLLPQTQLISLILVIWVQVGSRSGTIIGHRARVLPSPASCMFMICA